MYICMSFWFGRQVLLFFGSSFLSSFLYGGIVTYLEGRRSTEILLASISASLVFAGTLSRALAAQVLHLGLPPRLMPLLLGATAFLAAAALLVCTARAPPPSRADVAARSARSAMSPRQVKKSLTRFLRGFKSKDITYYCPPYTMYIGSMIQHHAAAWLKQNARGR